MRRLLLLITLIAMVSVTAANAAVITILNNDGVGEGFNDPTPAAPVGGNPGTTVGQQRLLVFQKAADIWGGLLPSTVTIIVRAQFNPQTCTATSAILGSAGPSEIWRDFPGAPLANTWYHVALANKLGGVDINPALYDINATFNSNLNGSPTCLNGTGWYLGFDGLEGTNIELLPVVLHELGHGLGFSAGIGSTGVLPGTPPYPTLYSRFMYDNTQGTTWDNMTDAQRAASAINTNNVVWNGDCANGHALSVLSDTPTTYINSDASATLAPKYVNGSASFGPTSYNVAGDLVLVDDGAAPNTDLCTAPINALAGLIAVIDRGTCTFASKAALAQAAGAIGVIIVNNAAGPAPGLGGADPSITIPVVSVSQADGTAIKAAMLIGTVNVTLGFDPSQLAGADANGRVKLFAPNPYQSGSSISHWDVSAVPNLLMEPAINSNLSSTTDLTFWMFGDLGWHDSCTNPVAVAISSFSASPVDGGVKLRATFYSTLADAALVTVYRADGGSAEFRTVSTADAPIDGKFTFIDDSVEHGRSYTYKIGVVDGDGEFFSQTAKVTMPGARIELSQNSPNPFNPSTTIRFSLPASERVTLAIYNANGALVRVLADGSRPAGSHDVAWDGRDTAGSPVTSGVYFYRLTAGKFSESKKMVLLK